jgi:hypothetical protein
VDVSKHSIKKAKGRTIVILETKLGMIRNVETDVNCCKEVLTEMKKAAVQPTVGYFFQEDF